MAPPLLATTPIRAQISPALLADASIFANFDDRIASLLRCRKSSELKASSSQNFVFFFCFFVFASLYGFSGGGYGSTSFGGVGGGSLVVLWQC